MDEALFYNALAIATRSDYSRLARLQKTHGSWEKSWLHLLPIEKASLEPREEYKKLETLNIRLILQEDSQYPKLLKEIPWPPFGLYFLGNTKALDGNTIAIVGTRKATQEGKELAKKFSEAFAHAHCTVISGLALGIDAASHAGALQAKGKTVGVLANGLDRFYPRENERLAKTILEQGGLMISEYPLGSPSLPYRFLERNRIISGLSRGIVLVEAPQSSGSLATARFAVEQNRDVFVVPGPVSHPNFFGSHELIRGGAELVVSPENVLEALHIEKNEASGTSGVLFETPEEEAILAALKQSTKPLSVDKIIELTNLKAKTANQTISFLILRNAIKETERGYSLFL